MDAGTIGVFIPILGILLGFFGVWTHHRQKMVRLRMQELNAAKDAREIAPEQTREVRELRERVGVLERIVTDGGYDLATRIEALRDERSTPPASERAAEAERLS
jgi:hypothetical protein